MAVRAKKLKNHSHESGNGSSPELNGHAEASLRVQPTHVEVQRAAARLYSQGYRRSQIARLLMSHLTPTMNGKPQEQRLASARAKLRRWEYTKKFRDYIYQLGLIAADVEMPEVFNGVMKQAKKGKVDAARLMLEVTGRHNPKGEQGDTTVVVAFGGNVPRPRRSIGTSTDDTIEGEATEINDG